VTRRVQGAQLDVARLRDRAVLDAAKVVVAMGHPPEHVVGGVPEHGRIEGLALLAASMT
jgi:hypothetical protein